MTNGAPKTIDWEKAAGLKKEPKLKLLDNIVKHMPTISDMGVGLILIFFGLTAWTGGGIGIRGAVDAEPTWISLASLPRWACVFMVWFGVDSLLFKGRVTPWFTRRYVTPAIESVLKATIGEDRLESWSKKLGKKKEEQK